MAQKKFYITTAIDYVNAPPHCGHAFEKTLADALARWHRLRGEEVFFLTGVDENAQKNVQAAEKAGVSVKEFVDKNAALFIKLCKKLNISYDDFIRTTASDHALVVQKILKKIIKKGDIYKGLYEGLYCVGCETYYTEKDLIDGKCPEHDTKPELRKEEAYFFKLAKYEKELLKIIPKYVVPESRKNEALARVKEGLTDICISRKGAKWGIDFPDDKDFKLWVWIDALINYVSGLKDKEKKYWPANMHVIGKGINFFHAVIWPALLLSAEYKLPEKLLVHGYLNIGGKKMSKSLGNTLNPLELLDKYSTDTIRYSLLKNSVFDDSDYSEELIVTRNNNELANKLGNLVTRVTTLAEKYGLEKTKPLSVKETVKNVENHLAELEVDKALSEIFSFIDVCNEYAQKTKPWATGDKKILYQLSHALKDIAILLSPFLPETAEKIAQTLHTKISWEALDKPLEIHSIKKADILFKKFDYVEEKQATPAKEGIAQYTDFTKFDLRAGTILKVADHPDASKLYVLTVDLGEAKPRTIVAGLKSFYTKEQLLNKQAVFVANLQPAVIRGVTSEGMILAVGTKDEKEVYFVTPDKHIKPGSKIR